MKIRWMSGARGATVPVGPPVTPQRTPGANANGAAFQLAARSSLPTAGIAVGWPALARVAGDL